MEDVLGLYAEPYDPSRPIVCVDEAGKELHVQVAEPVPVTPGHPAKEDYEYARPGTANLLVVEPLAETRQVTVTERRTATNFAAQMKALYDVLYPDAAAIRVVRDNLNTHAFGSPFAAFPPDDAWRLRRKLEFHYAPKHASWLNMAECELSVLGERGPARPPRPAPRSRNGSNVEGKNRQPRDNSTGGQCFPKCSSPLNGSPASSFHFAFCSSVSTPMSLSRQAVQWALYFSCCWSGLAE